MFKPRLSSSLSSALWSGHGVKQRYSHRFLIPGDPALTIGCVTGGEAINVVTSKTPFTQPIESQNSEMRWLGNFEAGVTCEHSFPCS